MKTTLGSTLKLLALSMAFPLLLSCGPKTSPPGATEPPKAPSASSPAYPVKVSANGRYLVDQKNTPFLIVGDTPQGLISRLNEKEIDDFFALKKKYDPSGLFSNKFYEKYGM